MTFHSYSSIENSYQTPYIDKIRDSIALGYFDKDMPWIVTEKVHGANFSVIVSGNVLKQAKRTGIMGDDDNFYGSHKVLGKYNKGFRRIYKEIKEEYADAVSVQCYGEIYGGQYPHPDVAKVKDAKLVQKGIWYTPDNDFYGFDIAVDYSNGTRKYIPQDKVIQLYSMAGIPYAKPLFQGTFGECLQYPNAFPTTIPSYHGLPDIEGNTCEGIVIKPMYDVRMRTGERPLVKNKNERFKEKCHGPKVLREPEVFPAEIQELLNTLLEYVCDNRLCNVLSHDTYELPQDMGRLIKDFTKDIMNDFVKDNHARWDLMEKADQKKLTKQMTAAAVTVIKEHYKISQ